MAHELIRGKVAKVLNKRMLALNVGSEDGVHEDMLFDVLSTAVCDVVDPDTREVIGYVTRPKARVRVARAGDKIALAYPQGTVAVNVGGQGLGRHLVVGGISDFLEPEKWVERPKMLKTREPAWEDLPLSDDYVESGDAVVEVSAEMADVDVNLSAQLVPEAEQEVLP